MLAAPGPVSPVVHADEANDVAALRELAQRSLSASGTGTVELFPGQLPKELPLALPLPVNSRLIGTIARRTSAQQVTWEVLFDSTDAPDAVVAFFSREVGGMGWAAPKPYDYAAYYVPSGFQSRRASAIPGPTSTPRPLPPNTPRNVTLCAPTSDVGLVVTARPASGGMTNVTVTLGSSYGQCDTSRRPTPGPLPTPPIPALSAPTEGSISLVDYEDLDENVSDATVETDLSPAELEMHYAGQLQAAGWTRIVGYVRGPLAWSVWSTPKGKQGYLSVLEIPGTRTRDVHLQVGSLANS